MFVENSESRYCSANSEEGLHGQASSWFRAPPKGNESLRTMAEVEFSQIQKNKQTLSENEKANQADQEKTARLKALRLAKKATSK